MKHTSGYGLFGLALAASMMVTGAGVVYRALSGGASQNRQQTVTPQPPASICTVCGPMPNQSGFGAGGTDEGPRRRSSILTAGSAD
jgi:hypothetical protein